MSASDLILIIDPPSETAVPVSPAVGVHSQPAGNDAGKKNRHRPEDETVVEEAADPGGDEPQHLIDRLA
jgi:hypothetical protein